VTARNTSLRWFVIFSLGFAGWRVLTTAAFLIFGPPIVSNYWLTEVFFLLSKGFLGECGQRGGYMEIRNVPADVVAQITKLQSVSLCSNIPGQVLVYLMMNPPREGEPSFGQYVRERDYILSELAGKAKLLAQGLDAIPGISCQPITGAMYAFPKVTLPEGRTDNEYCMALLEQTGICLVPGSGFGQAKGTAHFRTTILPPTDRIRDVVRRIAEFHAAWK